MSTQQTKYSKGLNSLPPYLFVRIDQLKQEERAKGADLIDLSIGDPDIPTPDHIVEAMSKAIRDSTTHRYPSSNGRLDFRQAAANWCKGRFGIDLNPENEIISLIGSKEGIGHTPFAFIDPGDVVLVPSPGYPVYQAATILAGGVPYPMPLLKENNFLPLLKDIPQDILSKAKLMFLNYPNNPTGAVSTLEFFRQVVDFAFKHHIIVCHDMAYSEMYYDNNTIPLPPFSKGEHAPHSFLEVLGAMDIGMEFFSLSKTYQMTGWRIGFAAGNRDLIAGLLKIKGNLDSGAFEAVQMAGVAALSSSQECTRKMREVYQERRAVLVNGLTQAGWDVYKSQATFYVWITTPAGYTSEEMSTRLLREFSIVATPGNGFGEYGEGYIRMALTVDTQRMQEAVDRILRW
ncbi:MAG: LL-diaminopimelate aminotransferase [Candidatus Desantisbacteria bacterium]